MARRNRGANRHHWVGIDINRVCQELRAIVVEEGLEILGEVAKKVADQANRLAPVLKNSDQTKKWKEMHRSWHEDTGPIKGNIVAMKSPNVPATWLVMSPSWYSHFVEYGTEGAEAPRHEWHIEMKEGRRPKMAFNYKGKRMVTDWVYHPDVQPQPFLRPAADSAEYFLIQILNQRYGV